MTPAPSPDVAGLVGWLPIESAPHDGDMLVTDGFNVAVAFRDSGMSSYRFFCPTSQSDLHFQPVSWMSFSQAATTLATLSAENERLTARVAELGNLLREAAEFVADNQIAEPNEATLTLCRNIDAALETKHD